jgi:hypothetical protein
MKGNKILNTVAVLGLTMASVFGQADEIKSSKDNKFAVGSPDFDELPSPNISTGASKKFKPKDWLEIEVKFKVQKLKSPPKDEYLDSVDVKWWIVVKGQDRKAYLMEKTVNHVNIPIDEEMIASVYISPNTLKLVFSGTTISLSPCPTASRMKVTVLSN